MFSEKKKGNFFLPFSRVYLLLWCSERHLRRTAGTSSLQLRMATFLFACAWRSSLVFGDPVRWLSSGAEPLRASESPIRRAFQKQVTGEGSLLPAHSGARRWLSAGSVLAQRTAGLSGLAVRAPRPTSRQRLGSVSLRSECITCCMFDTSSIPGKIS